MRMEVVNRIESVIKELWPSADVSTCVDGRLLRVMCLTTGWRASQESSHTGLSASEHSGSS